MGATDKRRMVNAALTEVARGYKNGDMIAEMVAPRVPVPKMKATYPIYGKEAFRALTLARARGAASNRMVLDLDTGELAMREFDCEIPVPWEDREESNLPIDEKIRATRATMRVIELNREIQTADLVFAAATYPNGQKVALTGNDQWSAAHADSDPFADVATGRAAVRSAIGQEPNTLVLGYPVFEALARHEKVLARMSTSSDRVVTEEILARLFNVRKVVVGRAVKVLPQTTTPVDVWGKHAALVYVPETRDAAEGEPAFAYCFEREGYPVTDEYRESAIKSDIVRTTVKRAVKVIGSDAGYLFQDAVA